MLGEPKNAPWIPIEALPVDLQAQCARTDVDREHPEARVYRMSRGVITLGFLVLMVGGLLALLSTRTPAFGSVYRTGLLATGLAFLGAWLALRRTRRFLSTGGQRLVIGPTCLVVVDAETVRVLPAERLAIHSDDVRLMGTTIHDSAGERSWRAALQRAQKAASDMAAQKADRFRTAAEQSQSMSVRRVRWRRRAPALAAAFAGVLVALILEAGPLDARAVRKMAAAANSYRFKVAVDEVVSARAAFVANLATDVQRLAIAASGNEDELRALLQKTTAEDPVRIDIVERLLKLCAARFPASGLTGIGQLTRLLEGITCASSTGTSFSFKYNDAEITEAAAQRLANDLAGKLKGFGWRGVTAEKVPLVPKNEPYLELKVSKEGQGFAGLIRVTVTAVVHDAHGVASEPFTYSTTISGP